MIEDELYPMSAVPRLMGIHEIAVRLDVSRQRVDQLTQRPDFPPPVAKLAAGRVYLARHVETFAKHWERRVGRPPRTETP